MDAYFPEEAVSSVVAVTSTLEDTTTTTNMPEANQTVLLKMEPPLNVTNTYSAESINSEDGEGRH